MRATTSRQRVQKPEYRRNLFGATLGGPILHDRLFFFGDYQGVKQLIGVTRISTVPTLTMSQGIFTGVSKIYDPVHHDGCEWASMCARSSPMT